MTTTLMMILMKFEALLVLETMKGSLSDTRPRFQIRNPRIKISVLPDTCVLIISTHDGLLEESICMFKSRLFI